MLNTSCYVAFYFTAVFTTTAGEGDTQKGRWNRVDYADDSVTVNGLLGPILLL